MSPIKPTLKTEIIPLILIILSFVLGFYFYTHFPARVPSHWNFQGQVDSWSSAGFGAFFLPFLLLGMYILFLVIPYLDPKKERYQEFKGTYHLFKGLIMFILFGIYLAAGYAALGYQVDIGLIVSLMIGLLFIIFGSQMSKIKSNWFIGIRTPWTLSNEEVWTKTHALGGKTFIIAGVLLILAGLLKNSWSLIVLLVGVCIAALVPVVYSYVLFRRITK